MTLPGCAARTIEVPGPVREVPVVKLVKDTPPAELLKCPEEPAGFPLDQVAQMSTASRAAAMRIGIALRVNSGRLRRLIRWLQPDACPAPVSAEPGK